MLTDDAMISVLQKAEELAGQRKSFDALKDSLEGKDEIDCYNNAYSKQYVKHSNTNGLVFTTTGQTELAKLIKVKKEEKRQEERDSIHARIADIEVENHKINRRRDQREFWTFVIAIVSLFVSILSLLSSGIAVYVSFTRC